MTDTDETLLMGYVRDSLMDGDVIATYLMEIQNNNTIESIINQTNTPNTQLFP